MKLRNILSTSLMFISAPVLADTYVCEACSPGTFSSGSTECKKCPAGTYSSFGATECKKCPAGTFSAEGATECSACPAYYYSNAGSAYCGRLSFNLTKANDAKESIKGIYYNMSLGNSYNCSSRQLYSTAVSVAGNNGTWYSSAEPLYKYLQDNNLSASLWCKGVPFSLLEERWWNGDKAAGFCVNNLNNQISSYNSSAKCYISSDRPYETDAWTSIDLTSCKTLPCNFAAGSRTLTLNPDGYLYVSGSKTSVKWTLSGNHTLPWDGFGNPADAK
ncbi:MAG: hypothetical protein K6F04_02975 [bacterium]|nr:hypothetical protein [bacterium]